MNKDYIGDDFDDFLKEEGIYEEVTKSALSNLQDIGMKAYWCDKLIEAIDKIAKDKYPNIKIWIDTGSKLNMCLAVIDQVYKDLKVTK